MDNASMLARIIGPMYLVLGLSVLFYAKSWLRLVDKFEKDHYQLFSFSLLSLILGLIFINIYNVWAWNLWLLITLTGWGFFIKGLFFFLAPEKWITGVMKMKSSSWIYFGAIVMLIAGFFLSYASYLAY